tara:strand:- start:71 stop:433 length:363 start_codon:yes stop_codon:yes gene_type:complete
MYELSKDLKMPLLCKKVFSFSSDTYMSPLFLPRNLLNKIVMKVKQKYKDEKKTVFNMAFLEGLNDLMNHPTNDERYDKETCEQGWRNGKSQCEKIDKRRGTDIKKILAIDPEVLEWWTSI